MADINQFTRSKDRLVEMIHQLVTKKASDPETAKYIQSLETALRTLELKIAEYQAKLDAAQGSGLLDLSF